MFCKGVELFDNKAKINTAPLLNSKEVIYTNEAYKRKIVLISILEDFIDSSRTYSKIFIAIMRKSEFSKDEKIFLFLLKYEGKNEIPIRIEFDNIFNAVNFVEDTVITLGNMFLSIDSRQLINPTPRFSHLYPPDIDWLLQHLLLKIPQYSLDKCDNCPFFMDIH